MSDEAATLWFQTSLTFEARPAGIYLITRELEQGIEALSSCRIGLLHLFMQHTSASLAVNENADPDVRGDLQRHLDVLAPRDAAHYRHTLEGSDDMPAHIKSVITGGDLTIPVADGRLRLGVWQGVYLCEHRDHGSTRTIVATLQGSKNKN